MTFIIVAVSVLWFMAELLTMEQKDLRKTLAQSYFNAAEELQLLRMDTYDRYSLH
jgi:hypothetical protein